MYSKNRIAQRQLQRHVTHSVYESLHISEEYESCFFVSSVEERLNRLHKLQPVSVE